MGPRHLLTAVLTASATLATLVVPAVPAEAAGTTYAERLHWTYTDSEKPNASNFDANVDAPVGRWRDQEGERHTSRSYFTYDISGLQGRIVSAARISLRPSRGEDCTKPTPVELWVTDPISSATTWRNPPAERTKVGTITLGGAGQECPSDAGWFDPAAQIRAAADAGKSQITFELRVAADVEHEPGTGWWLSKIAALPVTANFRPATPTDLSVSDKGCGTPDDPPYVRGTPKFSGQFTDPDGSQDRIAATFAWWPVDNEAARQEFSTSGDPAGLIWYELPWDQPLAEGSYAWTARSSDGTDTSDWSRNCYFRIDRHLPAQPIVTSADYPADGEAHGGTGVPGTFRFDPAGSDDVVAYRWGFLDPSEHTVAAPQPGAAVTLQIAPPNLLETYLYVESVNAAGNTSPRATYIFLVRVTRPAAIVEMGGVGLPSRLLLQPGVPGVTEYRYRIADGPEISVPAGPDGTASVEYTFTALGLVKLTVANYTAAGLAGVLVDTLNVSDAPKVTAPGADLNNALIGQPIEFTFAPRRAGVVGYEYQLNWDQPLLSVPAGPDGVATVGWTPDHMDFYSMVVRSVQGDGTTSEWSSLNIWVSD